MKNLILTGPSGVGKGTIGNRLLSTFPDVYEFSISCTSRPMRPGDEQGVNYFFISKEEFEEKIKNDEFVEYEEFAGNYYGTLRSEIERIQSKGKKFIMDVEPKGALSLQQIFPDAVAVLILPESFEILERMLVNRKSESDEKIKQRIEVAKEHAKYASSFEHQVINKYGDVDSTFNAIVEIIK